jgi:hypothetical protein
MKLNNWSILLLIVSIPVIIVILSSCTIIITPPPAPQYQPTAHFIYANQSTGNLNCAGVWEDGDYVAESFSLTQPSTIEVTAWSDNLPPSNFDIYIMTESQYNIYYGIWNANGNINNATYLYEWDLTQYQYYNEYYFDNYTNYPLPAGNYYLVIANNYYQFGRGAYGSASFNLVAYY